MNEIHPLKGKTIVLAGGAGFIGHNLALRLKEVGANPHVLDGLQVNHLGFHTSGYAENENAELYIAFLNDRLALLRKKKVGLHIIDLREYHAVNTAIATIKPDAIVHLAAVAHANTSNKDPYSTFDHSLRTLENVLDVARSGRTHVVYLSSSMVYGDFGADVVTEEKICNPLGIYGALKYGAEKLIIGYNQVFGVPYTIIRPSALYGERCVSRRVGQAFIENALQGKNLTINGDGKDRLDFTYVDDLIQGLMLALMNEKAYGEVFNITYGQGRPLAELAELVIARFPELTLSREPRDKLMPERGALSIEKAKKLLGYQPKFPLEKGFEMYINWYIDFAHKNKQLFKV